MCHSCGAPAAAVTGCTKLHCTGAAHDRFQHIILRGQLSDVNQRFVVQVGLHGCDLPLPGPSDAARLNECRKPFQSIPPGTAGLHDVFNHAVLGPCIGIGDHPVRCQEHVWVWFDCHFAAASARLREIDVSTA